MTRTWIGPPAEAEKETRGELISDHQWKNLAEALGVNPLKEVEFMAELEDLARRWGIDCRIG